MVDTENLNQRYGVHTAEFVNQNPVKYLLQKRNWAVNSMFITMPAAETSLHIERIVVGKMENGEDKYKFRITPAEPASVIGKTILNQAMHRCGAHETCDLAKAKEVITYVYSSYSNQAALEKRSSAREH
ncbi:MAG: hypothetical protein ACKVOE_02715 [Rickettsiales bacterium]